MKKSLLLILLLALGLRLVGLNQSLWHDEAIGALEVKNSTPLEIVTGFATVDNHPPFYYLTLQAWSSLFGYTEVGLRGLSVVFGVLSVWVVYKVALLTYKKENLASLSALLVATSALHIYYSQEARMYMMVALLASLSVYFFLKIIRSSTTINWIFFSISLTALVITDYIPVFLLPVFWIYAFSRKFRRDWWKKFIFAHLPLLVFGALWLPIFVIQLQRGAQLLQSFPQWQSVAGGVSLRHLGVAWAKFVLGRISLYDKNLYYSLVGLFSLPFALALYKGLGRVSKTRLVTLWLIVPLVLGFVSSFIFPAFIYFRFIFVLPAFYLILSKGILSFKRDSTRRKLVLAVLLANAIGWSVYITDANQQREQWRQAISFIESRISDNDTVLFAFFQPPAAFRWYTNGQYSVVGNLDPEVIRQELLNVRGVYYFDYLADLSDPARTIEGVVVENDYELVENFDFIGVGRVTYYKR